MYGMILLLFIEPPFQLSWKSDSMELLTNTTLKGGLR